MANPDRRFATKYQWKDRTHYDGSPTVAIPLLETDTLNIWFQPLLQPDNTIWAGWHWTDEEIARAISFDPDD